MISSNTPGARERARGIRRALALGVSAAGTCVVAAHAQDSPRSEMIQEVVVTGSRIARPDYEATSPVVTVSADTFKLSGEVQVETVLNSLPQLVPSITTTSNNPSNSGQANIDLRGLSGNSGAPRTLVLLDGSRLTPSNPAGVVDLNAVPSALIESVEILTGGSSSTYGSDAIAGVVNVRLKRDFDGVQLSVQSNMTEQSDGQTLLAEALMGGNFADDRGNVVLSLAYDDRDAVLAGDREFSRVARGPLLQPVGSSTVPDGRIDWGANAPGQSTINNVFSGYGVAPGTVLPTSPISFNTDRSLFSVGSGTAANPVANYRGDTSDPGYNPLSYSYNFSPVNNLQMPLTRRQIAGFGRYDLIPNAAEMYTRLMYTTYSSHQQLAATPVTCSGTQAGCAIPVTNSAIPADLAALLSSRATPGANLFFTRRMGEVGERIQENSYDVVQGLLGFRGDFVLGDHDWTWDVYGSWGRVNAEQLQSGNVSRARLQAAYNNPAVYASRGCALFDPFGANSITEACARAIAIKTSNILESLQTNFVGVLTGSLFDLPAGSIDFAVGAEYRKTEADFRPDEFLASGDVVGFNAQQPVSGEITVEEPFVEVAIPLLRDQPFADYLGLDLGYRYSDYNLAGTTDTYKVALQWTPIESLKLRGSYNRAVRAPSVNELFLPQQENFPQYTDPCNANSSFRTGPNAAQVTALCQAQGIPAALLPTFAQVNPQARAIVGGSLELTPETADTYTYGVTWQSAIDNDWMRSFSASLDYYSYEIEDVIQALQASSVIGRCFNQLGANPNFDPNNEFCRLFSRNPNTFSVTDVQTFSRNLAGLKQTGVDLNLEWGLPLSGFGMSESAGDLDFKLLLTHLLSMEQQETSVDPFIGREGTISQTVASAFPKYKGVLSTTYSFGDLQLRYNLRYVDGMDVINNNALLTTPTVGVKPYVPTYIYHDLTVRWNISEMVGLTGGAINIADKQPPIYTTDTQAGIQSNTDPSTYDVLGRRYFLNLVTKF